MLVSIRDDVTGQPTEFGQLDRIFHRIEDGAHDWVIDDEDVLLESAWIQSRQQHRGFIQRVVQNAAYPRHARFSRRLTVCGAPQATDELRPQQAAMFVSKPLFILMENKFTDGTLLDIAIEFLAHPEIAQLHKDACVNLIEYISAGGVGEITKHIDDHKQKADELGIPLRLIVFTDSDGLVPYSIDAPAQKVVNKCTQEHLACFILTKRAIENYIPDEIFDIWVSKPDNAASRTKIQTLKQMSPAQRDHFSIKKGFGQPKKPVAHDVPLFANLTPEGRGQWVSGLGDEVIYRLRDHKTELSPADLAAAIRRRDHSGDLDTIIKMIMAEL